MNAIEELEKLAAQASNRRKHFFSDSFYLLVRALTIADMMEAQKPGCLIELGIDRDVDNIRKSVNSFRETDFI